MFLRMYKSSDCALLAELFYQTVHNVNAGDYTKRQLDAWASGSVDLNAWDKSLSEHYTVVAVENDIITGFGDIDKSGYLDRLFVHKDYQRRGIASAICDKLEKKAKTITVHASVTAKTFFEQRGYIAVERRQVMRSGTALTNYVMQKQIAGPIFEFQKAIIIGCPGAGKSTFASILSEKTGLPLYHLDLLWHKPDRTTVDRNTFDKKLKEIISADKWIIDGNYGRTLEMRIKSCETVFLLDFPTDVCLNGAKSRIGRKRADMPWTETELDEEFRQWIIDFPKKQLPAVYDLLERYKSEKDIYIFHSRADADGYLSKTFG